MAKVYCVRTSYHYEGEEPLLFTLDETTARGFFAGRCELIKEQNKNSTYVSSQQDLELIAYELDRQLEYDYQTLESKSYRTIAGHSGIGRVGKH
jgi:hypothetical protein